MKTSSSDTPQRESGGGDHVDQVREQWRRVRPDLDTAPVAIVARVGRAAAYFDQSINALMARHGLTRSSWDVLATLRRSGPPFERSPTDLYRGLMRTSGTMTNRLKRLERDELIERVADPEDGRGLLVRLTAKGVELVDEMAALGSDELATLEVLLRKLLVPLESGHSDPPRQDSGVAHAAASSG
jgi:DNA-binding MarR family transcriptional regulator